MGSSRVYERTHDISRLEILGRPARQWRLRHTFEVKEILALSLTVSQVTRLRSLRLRSGPQFGVWRV